MKRSIEGSEKMELEGKALASSLSSSPEHATVVGLSGELGSGKTTFVKGVARAFGVTQTVTSPTFVIQKIYKLEGQPFRHLVHIDAYRLESAEELSVLGFNALLSDPGNLIIIEWPERVREILPPDIKMLHFEFINSSTRSIQENGYGKDR